MPKWRWEDAKKGFDLKGDGDARDDIENSASAERSHGGG
jgi:hypothetical protein